MFPLNKTIFFSSTIPLLAIIVAEEESESIAEIPFSTFEINIERLLPNKNVRLILLDDNNGISELAYKQAKALGYSKILILKEGVKGWLGAKFKLFDGINVPRIRQLSLVKFIYTCLLYTSPSPRDGLLSRMPSSA